AFNWSWQRGYPRTHGGNLALINPVTHKFNNEPLQPNRPYSVLCYAGTENKSAPTTSTKWFMVDTTFSDTSKASEIAHRLCHNAGGKFAVPTTSYWMDDAFAALKTQNHIVTNYQRVGENWIPNDGKSLLVP
ncbi:MAG: hypothetical protein V4591_06600, partial [Bdellovibrionota bacterium]